MAEVIYPRWVHRSGKASRVAETADEERAINAGWDAEEAPIPVEIVGAPIIDTAQLDRAWCDGVVTTLKTAIACGASAELIAKIRDEFEPHITSALDEIIPGPTDGEAAKPDVEAAGVNPLTSPRRGGWPKGKPRKAA